MINIKNNFMRRSNNFFGGVKMRRGNMTHATGETRRGWGGLAEYRSNLHGHGLH